MGWIGFFLNVTGTLLCFQKHRSCWLLWMTSSGFWLMHSIPAGEWPETAQWFTYLLVNGYGYWEWSKLKKK